MDEKKKSKKTLLLKWIPIIIQIITLVFTFVIFLHFEKPNKELSNSKLKIETEILPREFENNLRLTLYKEVKDAIGQKDTNMQKATLLIINEMLEEDSVFRVKLINILLQSTSSQELQQTQENLNNYHKEQISLNPKKYTIDVFYLEDNLKETEPLAKAVDSVLRSNCPGYTIRKRLLPKSINAKIGYQIHKNQIRYDIGTNEENVAKDIINYIRKSDILQNVPDTMAINNNTQNYLSIFIKNK